MKLTVCSSVCLYAFFSFPLAAQISDDIEIVEVTSAAFSHLNRHDLAAQLNAKGVSFSSAGGVSALPIINGMMGDRIQLLSDGAPITAACGNQMNPPLSYISDNQVAELDVFPGVSLVSAGGDNIAGVIQLKSLKARFSDDETLSFSDATADYLFRSNDNAQRVALDGTLASSTWYLRYAMTQEKADSFEDGDGNQVLDTLYKATNHALSAGYKDNAQQLLVKVSHQTIPYQGFPNQYMDMTDNHSTGATVNYQRSLGDIAVEGLLSFRDVEHEMGFFTEEKPGTMPMNTESQDMTASLRWTVPLVSDTTLLIGQEWHKNTLDDWWPPVPDSSMMGPNTYVNINNGKRERFAAFVEFQEIQASHWTLSTGMRAEYVLTDAGDVNGYSDNSMGMGMGMGMDNPNIDAANAFNARTRDKNNLLIDATFLARRELAKGHTLSLGVARKNRAPNLYERYTWGQSTMSMTMIGWFGDGNGYVGDIDLKPETAHTVSATYTISDDAWQTEGSIWYTQVQDYIDVAVLGTLNSSDAPQGERNRLQFTNLDATLAGLTLNGSWIIANTMAGQLVLKDTFTWQDGERDNDGGDLYQIVPYQNTLQLVHSDGSWTNSVEWVWTGKKEHVDVRRRENTTDSYSIVNLNTEYSFPSVTLRLSVTNLFDRLYAQPLGGVNVAQYRQEPENGFPPLYGRGRSLDVGVTLKF